MGKIIHLENVSFKYAGATEEAIKSVNFDVEKGEWVGIAGSSGCGKSTLLYCINGVIPHAIDGVKNGQTNLCGLDVEKTSLKKLATKAGMVFQNPEVQLFKVTVEDEVAFMAENLSYPVDKIRECVEFGLNSTGINELRSRYPFELSGGEKQKVAIASVMSVMPEVLLLDEPTSELDASGRDVVLETITKLNEKGMTVLMAEHNIDEAVRHMDRLILLDKGEIVADGSPEKIFRGDAFRRLHLRAPASIDVGLKLGSNDVLPLTTDGAAELLKKCIPRIRPERRETSQIKSITAVEVKNLHYRRDGKTILENINLTINEGELVGLIGQNGSGKTTLALLMARLLKPSKGSIKICNASKKIGLLFQNPEHQLFCDTVALEITYGLRKGTNVDTILTEMNLEKYRTRHPLALSRGERQRVATAAVLASEPDILIIDEPTTGLDWEHIQAFMLFIKRLNKSGKTIIMITHDMRIVAEYCPRLIVMKSGKIILDGDTRSIFSNPRTLEEAYLRPAPISEISLKAGICPPLLRIEELAVEEALGCQV